MSRSTPAGSAVRFGEPKSRAELLAAELERRMTEAGARTGDSIGTLEEIRLETGLARSTVNEAVRLLRDRGLLTIKPGRGGGLFVAASNPVVRLRHTLLTVRDAPVSVLDAIAVRESLEELIAVDAARHRTPDDIRDLRSHLKRLGGRTKDYADFLTANWKLHERIAAITPNAMASAVYLGTLGHLGASTTTFDDGEGWKAYAASRFAVHRDLVEAIIAADLDAVRSAVRRHNSPS